MKEYFDLNFPSTGANDAALGTLLFSSLVILLTRQRVLPRVPLFHEPVEVFSSGSFPPCISMRPTTFQQYIWIGRGEYRYEEFSVRLILICSVLLATRFDRLTEGFLTAFGVIARYSVILDRYN
jgi:hypothetical protein